VLLILKSPCTTFMEESEKCFFYPEHHMRPNNNNTEYLFSITPLTAVQCRNMGGLVYVAILVAVRPTGTCDIAKRTDQNFHCYVS
jgi:hypothetical protein